MPNYYPVYMNLQGRRCVVIGGGHLGEEKVHRLLDCEGEVVIISSDITDGVRVLVDAGEVTWIQKSYEPGDLEGAMLAIVVDTSNKSVNKRVAKEAMDRNVLLNVVDVTHLCTFIAPSIARRGSVTVATSTNGASPALARLFRERLTDSRLLEFGDLAPVLSDARSALAREGVKVAADHWQACITEELLDMVQAGRNEEARQTLMYDLLNGQTAVDG